MSQEIVEIIQHLPVTQLRYGDNGRELQMKCVADAKVNTDELIRVFGEIKRFLPPVSVADVRSDITNYTPGTTGEITVHWAAFSKRGRDYLMAIAQAIAKIHYKKLDHEQKKIETPTLSLENKRNPE